MKIELDLTFFLKNLISETFFDISVSRSVFSVSVSASADNFRFEIKKNEETSEPISAPFSRPETFGAKFKSV